MIDLHSHLLPAVDDGSRSVEQSLGVLATMARQGVTDLCLTPHLLASAADLGVPAAYDRAYEALRAAAPAEVRLHRGAEVMLDRPLSPAAAAQPGVRLGGSRYILVEFPRLVAAQTVHQALALLWRTGLVPVVAHPERYSSCSPEAVQDWKDLGAKMQVDATTLLAPTARGDRARRLVAYGLADIIAADNHGDTRSVAAGYAALVEHGGREQAELLTRVNPGAILRDAKLEPVPPFEFRTSFVQKLRRLLAWRDDDA